MTHEKANYAVVQRREMYGHGGSSMNWRNVPVESESHIVAMSLAECPESALVARLRLILGD